MNNAFYNHFFIEPWILKNLQKTNHISHDLFPFSQTTFFQPKDRFVSGRATRPRWSGAFLSPHPPRNPNPGMDPSPRFPPPPGRRIRPNICFNLTVHITSISTNRRQLAILPDRPTDCQSQHISALSGSSSEKYLPGGSRTNIPARSATWPIFIQSANGGNAMAWRLPWAFLPVRILG